MKKLLLSAMLPFTLAPGLDPVTRAFDQRVDNPTQLVSHARVEANLASIATITDAHRPQISWSDRAWDHNRGLLNERYTDTSYTALASWGDRRAYAEKWSMERAVQLPSGDARDRVIGSMSPAEKYDLLVGTIHGGLADANRDLLNDTMDANGVFPTWWGICEGSAAAALASPEPVSKVTVHSAPYNVDVTFYAPDIKALLSMLWSSYNGRLHLPEMGRQCDDQGGGACADVNPASFHRAIHYFLGLGNGNLVADIDATRVVWNHPLEGYETTYYRPDRGAKTATKSYREALLPAPNAGDPRSALRAPGTAYIVGVVTKLEYGENQRTHPLEGSVKRGLFHMDLQYELELDANLNLIGGEWVSRKHPDLLWTIPQGIVPDTAGDLQLGTSRWEGDSIPLSWQNPARESARAVMPLRKVVEGLLRRSLR